MTHINTARRVLNATTLVTLGNLAIRILQDPAVHKSWREAAGDCSRAIDSVATTVNTVARAVNSIARAGSETAASWRRHGGTDPLSHCPKS
ncbi:hypothetical protein GA0070624_3197 [Micromonospora rhizosphaerae]|uniref:Uncharacterized protein n=1 Tax=Micromonospora rhizosphaerae TaxID=568872 RepID=A0A1C6S8U3_9ACTN|nr:hypothetical protein GA0070624_3197 [Micromonospora rhizosphaerae]